MATTRASAGSHGEVVPLEPADPGARRCRTWAGTQLALAGRGHPVLAGLEPAHHAYFVHSYRFVPRRPGRPASPHRLWRRPIAAMVGRDNLVGTQFHPEKSQAVGLRLLANFLGWRP